MPVSQSNDRVWSLSMIGIIAAGVVSAGALFYLLAMPWPGDATARAERDQQVAALQTTRDAIELERARILIHELNSGVRGRLP